MACFEKRRCNLTSSSSNWADIPREILGSILEHLSFQDVLVAESVCSHWLSEAKSFMAFKSQTRYPPQAPVLFVFPQENASDSESGLLDILGEFTESCCIGASHGWLIFLDEAAAPLLFNPSLQVHIQLPCIASFLGVLNIKKDEEDGYRITFSYQKSPTYYVKNLREILIHKAILSSDPCFGINSFGAAVIYGYERKLAFCKNGYSSWTELNGKHQPYEDIISSRNNKLYALGHNASVEVWELGEVNEPVITMEIELTFPEKSMKFWREFGDLYTARLYLVESTTKGDMMLVVRFVGELVNGNDVPVHEEDLLTEEDTHPLICPYKTLEFHVYKLDLGHKSWVEVDCLGDQTLFLGGNHSLSVSADHHSSSSMGYKKNSIYFTDDYWDRMDEDYLYGGHDVGVFRLNKGSVQSFTESHQLKLQPPPCWVNHSPW